MTGEDLEQLLRAWGRIYGESASTLDAPEPLGQTTHPIARAMEFAPGKRTRIIRQRMHMDRAGYDRRRMMAEGAGGKLVGLRAVPGYFVDPIAGSTTRRAVYGMGELSRPVPPEIQRVQREWKALYGIDTQSGAVLRDEYQRRGMSQGEKAAVLGIGLRVYRESLARGKGWMLAKLAA